MMALKQCCWGTTVKLALPLLVVMVIAAAPSICGAAQSPERDEVVDLAEAAPVAKAGRGRFLASFDEVTPIGRKLLTFNFCGGLGTDTSNNCRSILLFATMPKCCTDPITGIKSCFDVAFNPFKCGNCTTRCAFGQFCCSGVCINPKTDPKNCGLCGRSCGNVPCKHGFCGY